MTWEEIPMGQVFIAGSDENLGLYVKGTLDGITYSLYIKSLSREEIGIRGFMYMPYNTSVIHHYIPVDLVEGREEEGERNDLE